MPKKFKRTPGDRHRPCASFIYFYRNLPNEVAEKAEKSSRNARFTAILELVTRACRVAPHWATCKMQPILLRRAVSSVVERLVYTQ